LYPVRAQQTNVRDPDRQGVARHMIRFRQDPDRQIAAGDSITELVLTNSHDRSAAYQLDLGKSSPPAKVFRRQRTWRIW
jgi:hypothetical protein